MKVKISVWRDDTGKLQPSRFVNEQTRQTMQVHPDGTRMRVFATVNIGRNSRQALADAIASGETRLV